MNPNAATSPLFRPAIMNAIRTPGGAVHPFPPLEYIQRQPIVLIGPPGVGATMIARRLTWFMEPLADIERTWLTAEYQASLGGYPFAGVYGRPFRAPHHTVSSAALSGAHQLLHRPTCASNRYPYASRCDCQRENVFRPGELQLARFGVLYLDELLEFRHAALERLVHEWRAMAAGRPWIVAHVGPCPCGRRSVNGSNAAGLCVCTELALASWDHRMRVYLKLLGIDRADPSRAIELEPFTRAELEELSRYKEPAR